MIYSRELVTPGRLTIHDHDHFFYQLPISSEYPKFVCVSCAEHLHRSARFAQQIEQNAENWETFLNSHGYARIQKIEQTYPGEFKDCHEQLNPEVPNEIKMEICDEFGENVDNVTSCAYDVLELPFLKDDVENISTPIEMPASGKKRKAKRRLGRAITKKWFTEFDRTCKHCDAPTFPSQAVFDDHQRLMHPGIKPYICDICGKGFSIKFVLTTHLRDRHSNYGRKFQCQFCAKCFYTDREVKVHEKLHLNKRRYNCHLCGKGFNTKSCLNAHLKSKLHNDAYDPTLKKKYPRKKIYKKVYRCEQCIPTTVYKTSEERNHHRNVVHKIHVCDICKNSFLTPESLDRHKLLHSDKPRPYVCSVNAFDFQRKNVLL